ncbi:hypothetical protein [Empedobacter sp. R132-2]|uniref:hypothetical protein n=1 Tax=Empedobacter sp. R132-2 TaxID=2746740 RepID=UPI00257672AA|nr:hypothetical protein [Empedobacter sp. R132-2]MDM1140049.1 hypothetical protein [Empedobacter sp. R132-2]
MKVLIQKQILIDLKLELHSRNKIKQMDYYVYFVSLLNNLRVKHRGDEQVDSIVRLNSSKMKKVYYNYSLVIKDLQDFGIINKVSNYSADLKKSNGYLINDKYISNDLESYNLTKTALLKKLNSISKEIPKHRIFLKSYFNDKLTFDFDKAIEYIESNYNKNQGQKYENRIIIANNWKHRIFEYSVNEDTDNRFHSLFTRTPKDLREFIKYDNEELIGYDLKSSQLFFLSLILKSIIEDDIDLREEIGFINFYDGLDLQYEIESLSLNNEEINTFINIVLNQDIYDWFSDKIDCCFDVVEDKFYVEYTSKGKLVKEYYETRRELSKKAFMIILNTGVDCKNAFYKTFNDCFPEISRIIKIIKKFYPMHKILQQVESFVLLDCVANDIDKENIPLLTIHDCFYTNKSNGKKLEQLMKKYIKQPVVHLY